MEERAFYKKLVERYSKHELSFEELEIFFHLFNEGKLTTLLSQSMQEEIMALEQRKMHKTFALRRFGRLAVACSIILMLLGGYYVLLPTNNKKKLENKQLLTDRNPGSEQAILTLASGKVIDLNSIPAGKEIDQSNIRIIKNGKGMVRYIFKNDKATNTRAQEMHTLKVPAGGQYEITLIDGTKVWLNAASTLEFPANFSGRERKVYLTGEAYFEVASAKGSEVRPFIVHTSHQLITVLGTRFDVNAYSNEKQVKTTLMQGGVKVATQEGERMLKPGQQAIVSHSGGKLNIAEVDVESVIDWKNGDFVFNNEELTSIMRKLERWYNIQVVYADNLPKGQYSGQIARNKKLTEVLKLLRLSGDGDFDFKWESGVLHVVPLS
ncbi:DUF4974 domain-containing protein [Olivibacter ginsenosidimutans]|uniref:DUF4974 domain-containing protein n=1 Tax=Olivibacter ginsenosidimutans TaxID=1176537 RepID=A0ABP9BZ28_9SPHI